MKTKHCDDPLCVGGYIRIGEDGDKIPCQACQMDAVENVVISRRFGEGVRGMRVQWRWSDAHGCYIRVSLSGLHPGANIMVEMATSGHIPSHVNSFSIDWWNDPMILRCCPVLEKVRLKHRMVEGYEAIIVNMDGEQVGLEKMKGSEKLMNA